MNNNILVLSAGTRVKIIEYLKAEFSGVGSIIAADCSKVAPALYIADDYIITPRIDDSEYIDFIIKICVEKNINAIISLIDPELSILSKNRELFEDKNIKLIMSDYDSIELCFDKYEFINYLAEKNFNSIKSYISLEQFNDAYNKNEINFPVFLKPNKGSASLNINKITTYEELELLSKKCEDYIIQEYIDGEEFGIDFYIDLNSGELVDLFIKKKLKMRAGETDKSVSVEDKEITDLVIKLVENLRLKGPLDMDVFRSNGKLYISEINPRFGGGYPHAYELGINFMKYIKNNIKGKENKKFEKTKYDKGIYMMKYSDIIIK